MTMPTEQELAEQAAIEEAERQLVIQAKAERDAAEQAADTPYVKIPGGPRAFEVHRRDQAENDPYSIHYGGCTYLVLDLDHDPIARDAAAAYADACATSHPQFSASLRALLDGTG